MAVSKRTRFEVFRRDGFRCRYCALAAPEGDGLTIDHVTPVALGGTDAPDNLVAACKDCNAGKSSASPDAPMVAQVSEDAMRWAAAMKVVAEAQVAELSAVKAYRETFLEEWRTWDANLKDLNTEWRASLGQFQRAGLPIEVLCDDLDIAWGNRKIPARATFRYLCGIAWKQITEMQKSAREQFSPGGESGTEYCGHCEACLDRDLDDPEDTFCEANDYEDDPCDKCGRLDCLYRAGQYSGGIEGHREGYRAGRDRGYEEANSTSFETMGPRALGHYFLECVTDGKRMGELHSDGNFYWQNGYQKDAKIWLDETQAAIDTGTFWKLVDAAIPEEAPF